MGVASLGKPPTGGDIGYSRPEVRMKGIRLNSAWQQDVKFIKDVE